jgi:hypothetical protein
MHSLGEYSAFRVNGNITLLIILKYKVSLALKIALCDHKGLNKFILHNNRLGSLAKCFRRLKITKYCLLNDYV